MERILCLVIGYCFGLIQTSYILGRIHGMDIRKKGSGNAGTTNAIRTLGWKNGVLTAVVDVMKCIVIVLIMKYVFRDTGLAQMYGMYTAAGVVLGHDFPFYLKFKGGKGIAVSCGMIIAFGDWRLIVAGLICFFTPILLTHFVSLGSLAVSTSFLVGQIILGQLGCFNMPKEALLQMYVITAILTALAWWLHRSNLKRLAAGNENKLW